MDEPLRGVLSTDGEAAFLLAPDGSRLLADELIWPGYVRHWLGRPVRARRLPQKDYERDRHIVLVWPDEPPAAAPFVELYYNERLVRYRTSFLGHNAINVDGEVFNFSHLLTENESLSPEEYLYRPALGEFAPSPITGRTDASDPGRPYHNKFGRAFLRTIHVLRVEGLDTARLADIYRAELEAIRRTPPDPRRPAKYRDFSILSRSCTTILRDGLRRYGFPELDGTFPRDLYVAAAWHLSAPARRGSLRVSVRRMPQLLVPEAPPSALTPLLDPRNRVRLGLLRLRGLKL